MKVEDIILANNINTINEENGSLSYADDVVASIAGMAAVEIDGIHSMSGNFGNGIAELFGKKAAATKGVQVEVGHEEAAVDLYVVVQYGALIPAVTEKVQANVKKAIETMTGLDVVEVNVHVDGVHVPLNKEGKEEPTDDKRVK